MEGLGKAISEGEIPESRLLGFIHILLTWVFSTWGGGGEEGEKSMVMERGLICVVKR